MNLKALGLLVLLTGCGAPHKIPKFDGTIFVLDNKEMLLRYRYDKFTIPVTHPSARGAIVFLPEQFEAFIATYFLQCREWSEDIEFINSNKFLEENGINNR